MAQIYSEDDLYRTSTQYQLWSFSPDELASLRASTNAAAIERAKTYLSDTSQCLTLIEEVRLIQRYCEQVRSTCDFFKWGINVKATAVQYLKRFYLTNSAMTYPPKEIYKSVLFLASKTEGVHMTLGEFARRIKSNQEDILAPEYKIIQSLRFTLDVRQPFRGLRGCLMELLNIANGDAPVLSNTSSGAADQRKALSSLPPPSAPAFAPSTTLSSWVLSQPLPDRAHVAYTSARQTLDAPALLTDVYFLYTPPQLYLAALLLADEPLVNFYLSSKLPSNPPASSNGNGHTAEPSLLEQVKSTLLSCAQMLADHDKNPVMTKDERAALEERLEVVRDPATKDLVGMHKVAKGGTGEEQEEKAKRRKEERERAEREGDVFGGNL
ncbi:Cyclin-like protein 3 [Elsinoe fawcettii]|nr:Cyclin-like protein 3 [Elsinoe fawcettii]